MKKPYELIRQIKERAKFKDKYTSYTCLCGCTVAKDSPKPHRCFNKIGEDYLRMIQENFDTTEKRVAKLENDIQNYKQWIEEYDEGKEDIHGDRPYMEQRLETYPKMVYELKNRKPLKEHTWECLFCHKEILFADFVEALKEKLPFIEYYGKFICPDCIFCLNINY